MAEEKGVWRTVAGRRIFIRDGESLSDSMKRSGKFKGKIFDTKKKTKLDMQTEESDEDYAKRKLKEAGDDPIMKRAAERKLKEAEEKKNDNSKEEKMAAIKEAYEKQQSFKDTTYEVMEKDGKYRVVGGNNNGSDDPGSWRSKKRDLLERGYKELPDSDYKEFMNSVKEKKYDNGRTEKTYEQKKINNNYESRYGFKKCR